MARRTKKKWCYQPLFLVVLFLLLIVFARATYASFIKKDKAQKQYDRYHQELVDLEEKKEDLIENIQRLETQRGREEEYRERFNVIREGEKVIRIIEEESDF